MLMKIGGAAGVIGVLVAQHFSGAETDVGYESCKSSMRSAPIWEVSDFTKL